MKLVTFAIDEHTSLIIQFPVFCTAICSKTADTLSIRNSTSSHCRSKINMQILTLTCR